MEWDSTPQIDGYPRRIEGSFYGCKYLCYSSILIKSFKLKGLARFFQDDDATGIRADLVKHARRRLSALDVAERLDDLKVPGFNFHRLQGKPKRYSFHVNGPWTITFEWINGDAWRVDLEQYHCEEHMKTEYVLNEEPRMKPVHPGEILREDVLPELGITVSEAARQLAVSRQTLHHILSETHSITPEMALRLGKFCGNGPGLWLRMQQRYDLWRAKKRLSHIIDKIPNHSQPRP